MVANRDENRVDPNTSLERLSNLRCAGRPIDAIRRSRNCTGRSSDNEYPARKDHAEAESRNPRRPLRPRDPVGRRGNLSAAATGSTDSHKQSSRENDLVIAIRGR